MTKREFLDIVFALAPTEANAIMDAFDEYVDSNEPPWIPVTERLPEKNGDYLCQEKLGFLYVDTWNGECWDIARSSFGIVVAWMPLPEHYKG